jgi:hypothetical protein
VTAKRLRATVEAILGAATVQGLRSGQNPAQWRHNLDHFLPKHGKVHTVRHHSSLPYSEVPAVMARLAEAKRYMGAYALRLGILCATRPVEGARSSLV